MDIIVITPVYNSFKYLKESVDSVLGQNSKKNIIEIVLIDDGSTDGTNVLCDTLAEQDSRICVIHQENRGVSAARNTGIQFVLEKYNNNLREKYFAFLDSDDKWKEDFVSNLTGLSKYDLIGFLSATYSSDFQICRQSAPLIEGIYKGGIESVWIHSSQHFGAMLYSAELIKRYNIRFFERLHYSEDQIFRIQCMYLAKSIYLTNKSMLMYRKTSGSAMYNRPFGLIYYKPIIDAYIRMDKDMEVFASEERGLLREGHKISSLFIMEGIKEQYHFGGKMEQIMSFLEDNTEYTSILENRELLNNCEYWEMKKNPTLFFLKHKMMGFRIVIYRFVKKTITRFR